MLLFLLSGAISFTSKFWWTLKSTSECKQMCPNKPELLSAEEDGKDIDYPICILRPTNIIITRCAYVYCNSCIIKTLKRAKPRKKLVIMLKLSLPLNHLKYLLSWNLYQHHAIRTEKSVTFSKFRKMLILLEYLLKNAGFKILRLDRSMNAIQRAQVVKDFGVPAPDDGPAVLLASLNCIRYWS